MQAVQILLTPPSADGPQVAKELEVVRQLLADMRGVDDAMPSNYAKLQSLVSSATDLPAGSSELLAGVLALYRVTLEDRLRVQRGIFRKIRAFVESANRFLEGKQIVASSKSTRARVAFPGIQKPESLDILSSGERHVMTMLFCATHMAKGDGTILIDEPELSLHVEWQRDILDEIMKQASGRQVVVCTHAPEITAKHIRCLRELNSLPTEVQQQADGLFPNTGQDSAEQVAE